MITSHDVSYRDLFCDDSYCPFGLISFLKNQDSRLKNKELKKKKGLSILEDSVNSSLQKSSLKPSPFEQSSFLDEVDEASIA